MPSVRATPRPVTPPATTSTSTSTSTTPRTGAQTPKTAGAGWVASPTANDINGKAAKVVAADPKLQALVNAAKPAFAGKKVLMVGDSHTVGFFGERFDTLLRAAGAKTRSYGTAGSKPSWWVAGTSGAMGASVRETNRVIDDGKPWNTKRPTPKLADLLGAEKPDVLVIALGANFRAESAKGLTSQVRALADQAKALGITLVWVGPPNTKQDLAAPEGLKRFDAAVATALGPDGTYVASSPHTQTYSGSDGVHFNGAAGRALANDWAGAVFSDAAKSLLGR
ncbi:MAG: hypothetical protein JNG84_12655 [Archangium sp.]|nr:hypothetical protein [Archangium sp.]